MPTPTLLGYLEILTFTNNALFDMFGQFEQEAKTGKFKQSFYNEIKADVEQRIENNQAVMFDLQKEIQSRIKKSLGPKISSLDDVNKIHNKIAKELEDSQKPVYNAGLKKT